MRWRLEQILIRLSRLFLRLRFRLLLDRLRLRRTRRLLVWLFRYPRLCFRLLHRLGLRPLLLLLLLDLLLRLTSLQRLLALCRRLLIPRYFVQLRRLLAHIGLHLGQQLTLFIRQLIRILHFTTRRRFGWRTHPRLTAFQLFDIAPALFRLRRKAISGNFIGLKRLRLFFLWCVIKYRPPIKATTTAAAIATIAGETAGRLRCFFLELLFLRREGAGWPRRT